ncbi:MAG: hypothetical protein HDR98_11840 [Bacteroides sp.]|nr:hypothetical protein [Bacteroides sp.]
MAKELTAKEKIIELSRTLSPAEIAVTIGTSVQYVYKVLRNAATSKNKPLLTLQNYIAAHRKGITKKNDLAAFFGVSRMTINRFENRPDIKQHFSRYMELQNNGYELNKLLQHSTAILETILPFEPGSAVAATLRQVITLLSKCDKLTN